MESIILMVGVGIPVVTRSTKVVLTNPPPHMHTHVRCSEDDADKD